MNCCLSVSELGVEIDYRKIFSNIHFEVKSGQLCQLYGPNGSGKSTLLSVLVGLYPEFEGQVNWVLNAQTMASAELNHQAVYLSTRLGLSAQLSVAENIHWMAALKGVSINAEEELVALLARMTLAPRLLSRKVAQLSSGQQQKVKLLRLLINPLPIWLLDEPFTALDPEAVSLLENLLLNHIKMGGLVIYASHHQALSLSPDVIVAL